MTEWLRWLPAKQLGEARASSNLAAVEKKLKDFFSFFSFNKSEVRKRVKNITKQSNNVSICRSIER